MTLLEAISPTARELLKVAPNWFVIQSPNRTFSLLANPHRKPRLPAGYQFKGPFKTRDTAIVKSLKWELATRPQTCMRSARISEEKR